MSVVLVLLTPELQQTIAAERQSITPVTIDDDPGSLTRGVGEVLAPAGRIDALVNDAGIGGGGQSKTFRSTGRRASSRRTTSARFG